MAKLMRDCTGYSYGDRRVVEVYASRLSGRIRQVPPMLPEDKPDEKCWLFTSDNCLLNVAATRTLETLKHISEGACLTGCADPIALQMKWMCSLDKDTNMIFCVRKDGDDACGYRPMVMSVVWSKIKGKQVTYKMAKDAATHGFGFILFKAFEFEYENQGIFDIIEEMKKEA